MVLKEDKEFAISGIYKGSVREETSVVSGAMKISVRNRHRKLLHFLDNQHKEEERYREKNSKTDVHLGSSLDSRAKMT